MYIEVKDAIYMERGKSGGVFFLFFFAFCVFLGVLGGVSESRALSTDKSWNQSRYRSQRTDQGNRSS